MTQAYTCYLLTIYSNKKTVVEDEGVYYICFLFFLYQIFYLQNARFEF